MSRTIAPGTYVLGPTTATLTVKTKKSGAAAKAGHDLTIEVTDWEATFALGTDPAQSSITLTADATSLKVREGHGGMMALGDQEIASIEQSIDDDVLKATTIAFRSTAITPGAQPGRLDVAGELELHGRTRPISSVITVGEDGTVTGSTIVKQTDWGMKPYSALFGTLKVVDEVEVLVSATLGTG
ncbi:MAG: YceI family protein [Solirubrobacterales bacterium]|nr:YceI family protein [Solirubrobacterales bacterium]